MEDGASYGQSSEGEALLLIQSVSRRGSMSLENAVADDDEVVVAAHHA